MSTNYLQKLAFAAAFCLLFFSSNSFAQSYSFETVTSNYTPLENSTSLNEGITWDDPNYEIELGFDFQFFDLGLDQITLSGTLGLGGLFAAESDNASFVAVLSPFFADIVDRGADTTAYDGLPNSLSNISYLIDGEEGSRIFKIEWDNAGFFNDIYVDNVSTDYINFQMWLYEGSNNIEVHWGENSITQPAIVYDGDPGSIIGFAPRYNPFGNFFIGEAIALVGDAAAPEAILPEGLTDAVTGTPPNGTVYRFTFVGPPLGGNTVLNPHTTNITIAPNPIQTHFAIENQQADLQIETVRIFNVNGQLVQSKLFRNQTQQIAVNDLSAGMYLIQLQTNQGILNKKVVIE